MSTSIREWKGKDRKGKERRGEERKEEKRNEKERIERGKERRGKERRERGKGKEFGRKNVCQLTNPPNWRIGHNISISQPCRLHSK